MSKLNRSLTTQELIQLNKIFADGRGYKDLMRDFKKHFNVEMTKQEAKHFLESRKWDELLLWLTGDKIEPADNTIPAIPQKTFEMLDLMMKLNNEDEAERQNDLTLFESSEYYIPYDVKFFNIPLFGEIITYKQRDPYVKCFIFDKGKLNKVEDVYITNEMPEFLLRIIRKINASYQEVNMTRKEFLNNTKITSEKNYFNMMITSEVHERQLKNIFESELFIKYNIVSKT
jgi:hypothetical protein